MALLPGSGPAHGGDDVAAPRGAGTAAGYVQDQQCASCHSDLYRSYQHVAMARSFSRPRQVGGIESLQVDRFYHEPSRQYYEITWRGGALVMGRYQIDEDGRQINFIEQQIEWVVGSGDHAHSYLSRNEAGELFLLPVSWYAESGRWWMAPGYDGARHSGLSRQAIRDCIFCHTAYPDLPSGADGYGQPHVFPRDLPEGIGCQRCHGPGAEHVRRAEDLAVPIEAIRTSITNPARLSPQLRDDVCYQCHLLSSSSKTSIIRRFGRGDYSFRPGEPLSDFEVHMDFDYFSTGMERFEVDHHPYRLRKSTCYQRSAGKMSCLTCHDPHRKVPPAEAAAYYRERCLACHQPQDCPPQRMRADGADSDCVSCHMPKRRAHDAVHLVMTDHGIRREPLQDGLAPREELPPPAAMRVKLYWPDRGPPAPMAAVYRDIADAEGGNRLAVDRLAASIAAAASQAIEPYLRLGEAQMGIGRYQEALATFTSVLERQRSGPALALAGHALIELQRYDEALDPLAAALELAPSSPATHCDVAVAHAALGRFDEAERAFKQAVSLRPTFAVAWSALGNLYARQGRFQDASDAYRRALAAEPNLAPPYLELGRTLQLGGDPHEAIRVWRHGANLNAADRALSRELARAYLAPVDPSMLDPVAGLQFARAAAANSRYPEGPAAVLLALAQLRNGRIEEAIEMAGRAALFNADQASCHLVIALAHLQAGRIVAALLSEARAREALAAAAGDDPLRTALLSEAEAAFCEASEQTATEEAGLKTQ